MKYCPVCRTVRNVRVSIQDKQVNDILENIVFDVHSIEESIQQKKLTKPKNIKEILIKSYHCESCDSFIYSEEINDQT